MIFNSNVGSLLNPGSGGYGAAFEKAVMYGIVRAGVAKLQGQKVSSGFWSGFVASGFSVGTSGYGGTPGRTFIMAVVGGTTSELTGGKFANGAVTGAFVHLFNAEASVVPSVEEEAMQDESDIFIFGGLLKLFRAGRELVIGKIRIAPLGNRTGNKYGRWPHYHRARYKPNGYVKHGQGISRHRPWETKPSDKSFWDRF